MILSRDFTQDVIQSDSFRYRLCLYAIDEIHCVEDWKHFRPMYSKLGILRSRLPVVPYLGVTASLTPASENIIRAAGGFDHSCIIRRTSIDRPEISIHVFFAEGNLSEFEDLRRFFPLTTPDQRRISMPKQLPKTVFYFNSKKDLDAFVEYVRSRWMPEFGYPAESSRWIQPYHSLMADYDKKRISEEFERPDNSVDGRPTSGIRILAATEGYGLGADNPDIMNVVNFRTPLSLNSLTQRMGRAKRNGVPGGRFFLVADPFTSRVPLPSKTARRAPVSNRSRRHSDTDTGSDTQTRTARNNRDQQDAERREKQPKDLIDFINAPNCFRLALLAAYGDQTYTGGNARPIECCSLCNPGHIPEHRPLPAREEGSAFEDIMRSKLEEWRMRTASDLLPDGAPVISTAILPDSMLARLAKLQPSDIKANPEELKSRLRSWNFAERYAGSLNQVFEHVANAPAADVVSYIHAAKVKNKEKKVRNQRAVSQDAVPLTPVEDRVERKNRWLISRGRQDLVTRSQTKQAKRGRRPPQTEDSINLTPPAGAVPAIGPTPPVTQQPAASQASNLDLSQFADDHITVEPSTTQVDRSTSSSVRTTGVMSSQSYLPVSSNDTIITRPALCEITANTRVRNRVAGKKKAH